MPTKYVFSDRKLRKILKRVDKQRVTGLPKSGGGRVWPMVEYGIPYDDEEFMCGLLTCEFRGWVERFGDEVPGHNMKSAQEAYQNLFRITQAGRAVLDRTQAIANLALLIAVISLAVSIVSFRVDTTRPGARSTIEHSDANSQGSATAKGSR